MANIFRTGQIFIKQRLNEDFVQGEHEYQREVFSTLQNTCGLTNTFPRTSPVLQLLDTLQLRRATIYQNLFEHIKFQIETICSTLPEQELYALLRETLPFFAFKELQSIPIFIVNKLQTIPRKVLHKLCEKDLLDTMPLRVRQAAWKDDKELFRKRLESHFSKISDPSTIPAIASDTGRDVLLFSEFASYCAEVFPTTRTSGSVLRQVLLHLQQEDMRIHALGKLHDLASHIDLCCSKKLSQEGIEREIVSALLSIVHSETAKTLFDDKRGLKRTVQQIQQSDLEQAWQFLSKLDVDRVFAERLTDALAPGYTRKIKTPMDLSTIRAKLPMYAELADMDADVRLMFRNCKDFNGPGYFAQLAGRFLKEWCLYRDRLKQRLAEGPARKKVTIAPPVPAESLPAPLTEVPRVTPPPASAAEPVFIEKPVAPMVLKQTLLAAWIALSRADNEGAFAKAVTEDIAPKYFSVIKTPMDLGTIKVKLDRGLYKSVSAFHNDITLMFNNAMTYNAPKTKYHDLALRVQSEWKAIRLATIRELFEDKDSQPPAPIIAPPPVVPVATAPAVTVAPAPTEEASRLPLRLRVVPKVETKRSSAPAPPTSILDTDLPSNVVSSKVTWAVCILREPHLQQLLRLRFVYCIEEVLRGHLAADASLLFESATLRQVLQLIQISWYDVHEIRPCDDIMLRKLLPKLLLSLIQSVDKELSVADISELVASLVGADEYSERNGHEALLLEVAKGIPPTIGKYFKRRV